MVTVGGRQQYKIRHAMGPPWDELGDIKKILEAHCEASTSWAMWYWTEEDAHLFTSYYASAELLHFYQRINCRYKTVASDFFRCVLSQVLEGIWLDLRSGTVQKNYDMCLNWGDIQEQVMVQTPLHKKNYNGLFGEVPLWFFVFGYGVRELFRTWERFLIIRCQNYLDQCSDGIVDPYSFRVKWEDMFGRQGVLSLAQCAMTLAVHSFTSSSRFARPELACHVDINAALRIHKLYGARTPWNKVQGKLFWANSAKASAHVHYSMLAEAQGPILFGDVCSSTLGSLPLPPGFEDRPTAMSALKEEELSEGGQGGSSAGSESATLVSGSAPPASVALPEGVGESGTERARRRMSLAISTPPGPLTILDVLWNRVQCDGIPLARKLWITWPPASLAQVDLEAFVKVSHKRRLDVWKGMKAARSPDWPLYTRLPPNFPPEEDTFVAKELALKKCQSFHQGEHVACHHNLSWVWEHDAAVPLPVLTNVVGPDTATWPLRVQESFLVAPNGLPGFALNIQEDHWGEALPSLAQELRPDLHGHWRRDFVPCIDPMQGCWRPTPIPALPLTTLFQILGDKFCADDIYEYYKNCKLLTRKCRTIDGKHRGRSSGADNPPPPGGPSSSSGSGTQPRPPGGSDQGQARPAQYWRANPAQPSPAGHASWQYGKAKGKGHKGGGPRGAYP